jgi:hypothetical protein
MKRATRVAALLAALAAGPTGCAWGYVTYFEPERGGAREVAHRDPYARPAPPAGVELGAGSLAVGCTNLRKFVLLPFPWLRRGFRPNDVQIEIAFANEPRAVLIDVGAVAVTIDGVARRPKRVEYQGERPAPQYVETVVLPSAGRARLESPTLLTFTFAADAGPASDFQLSLGDIQIDGARTRIPPLAFSREGRFVSYRRPPKKPRIASEAEAAGDF